MNFFKTAAATVLTVGTIIATAPEAQARFNCNDPNLHPDAAAACAMETEHQQQQTATCNNKIIELGPTHQCITSHRRILKYE